MESKWLRTDIQRLQSDAVTACLHSLVQAGAALSIRLEH